MPSLTFSRLRTPGAWSRSCRAGGASDRILGFQPWIHEDPALIGLDARWRVMDAFGDYAQMLTLAVPPPTPLRSSRGTPGGCCGSRPDMLPGSTPGRNA